MQSLGHTGARARTQEQGQDREGRPAMLLVGMRLGCPQSPTTRMTCQHGKPSQRPTAGRGARTRALQARGPTQGHVSQGKDLAAPRVEAQPQLTASHPGEASPTQRCVSAATF